MREIIVDFEFTGLDNSFLSDNEIVQFKAMNVQTGEVICVNYNSDKEIGSYSYLIHLTKKYDGVKFSKTEFINALSLIGASIDDDVFFGFGTSQDKKMLLKYGIDIKIQDIREFYQLSEYDSKLALEGSGLEAVYYIVTNEVPQPTSHNGTDELYLIRKLFDHSINIKHKKYFEVMPHGHCAGMPISQYVIEHRRQADGYRYNNSDLLSNSLNNAIDNLEQEVEDCDEDFFN